MVTFSAATKAGYALSLLGSAGLSAKPPSKGWACVPSDFNIAMGDVLRLAPSRGELSAKLTERGCACVPSVFPSVMGIFKADS